MSANVEKFVPPDCTRFGGIRNGKVICLLDNKFMLVPPAHCHCAYQYENRYMRKKGDGVERVRLFCEGERLRMENKIPEFYETYFPGISGLRFVPRDERRMFRRHRLDGEQQRHKRHGSLYLDYARRQGYHV